jgi:plastocyanin
MGPISDVQSECPIPGPARAVRRGLRTLVILMAVVALFGAGCGSSDKKDDPTVGATATTLGSPVSLPAGTPFHGTAKASDGMELELDNFYFGPTVVQATPGQAFKVELKNEGSAAHTFTIDSLGIDVKLDPDQTMEVTITAPADAGTVPFYCRFHQASQNMQGALVVG